ncbi:MAG: FAD-binding domain-containing protein [Woeseiaceae bacterium]|nr:FAD-binding domain-containing protein [Woeseiaceae bacterium]
MFTSATRSAGLERTETFVRTGARQYAKARNFDFGPNNRANVSTLSPYIRHRLILEQEVISQTLARHSAGHVSKFLEEVFWRAYFKGWLQHRPAVWSDYQASLRTLIGQLEAEPTLLDRYNAAVGGNTGIDCFDAWARELVDTGYLHNHARMWFASIWVFTLKLPWQLGADFFLRHLVDGDPASNTLSWRWVSGLHTKGKTYLARVSNIVNYTDGRFDPKGLSTTAEPLTERAEYEPQALEFRDELLPTESYGLLVTEDDCYPETLASGLQPVAVTGGLAIRNRSALPVGIEAFNFSSAAVRDAVDRASRHFGVEGGYFEADDWSESLAEWATKHHVNTIVTAMPPVGPVADALSAATHALARYGIRIVELSRAYDREAWPHAQRGYFKLKKQIPAIIDRLELDELEPVMPQRVAAGDETRLSSGG